MDGQHTFVMCTRCGFRPVPGCILAFMGDWCNDCMEPDDVFEIARRQIAWAPHDGETHALVEWLTSQCFGLVDLMDGDHYHGTVIDPRVHAGEQD